MRYMIADYHKYGVVGRVECACGSLFVLGFESHPAKPGNSCVQARCKYCNAPVIRIITATKVGNLLWSSVECTSGCAGYSTATNTVVGRGMSITIEPAQPPSEVRKAKILNRVQSVIGMMESLGHQTPRVKVIDVSEKDPLVMSCSACNETSKVFMEDMPVLDYSGPATFFSCKKLQRKP